MVVQGSGEKSDPPHHLKRLTEYSCWANGAQMATHISVQGVTPINTDYIQYCLVNGL